MYTIFRAYEKRTYLFPGHSLYRTIIVVGTDERAGRNKDSVRILMSLDGGGDGAQKIVVEIYTAIPHQHIHEFYAKFNQFLITLAGA